MGDCCSPKRERSRRRRSDPRLDDEWLPRSAFYSPTGGRIRYVATRKGAAYVVVDGVPGPPFDNISKQARPLFSPDSRHYAYGGIRRGRGVLVLDGQVRDEDALAPVAPVFSPDSRHFAYAVESQKQASAKQWVIRDETAEPAVDRLIHVGDEGDALVFSPDGLHLAYAGVRDGNSRMYVDTQPGPAFVVLGRPAFSPDSRRMAYMGGRSDQARSLVVDGSPGPGFAAIDERYAVTFSPDGAHFAYVAQKSSGQLVPVVDHEAGPEGTGWAPALEPAGRIWFLGATPESLRRWDWTGTQPDVYGRP